MTEELDQLLKDILESENTTVELPIEINLDMAAW